MVITQTTKRLMTMSRISLAACICLLATTLSADDAVTGDRLAINDKAIDFELPIVDGDGYLSLSDEYRQGPVVVVVLRGYPGYQCPLCSRQVGSLANRAKTLSRYAHRVILVYPGEAELLERHAEEFMGSRSLPRPLTIVRDDDMKMVSDWGLRWNAPRETAYPATYVIDKNGRVRWSEVSSSHAGRTSAGEIIAQLKKIE